MSLIEEISIPLGETPREIMKRRLAGIPWFLRGHGNRSSRRAWAKVQAQIASRQFTSEFDRLLKAGERAAMIGGES